MNTTIQLPGEWRWAFDHLAAYGAAAIAEAGGHEGVRLRWTDSIESRVELSGVDWGELARVVHAHAADHTADSWVQADGEAADKVKALFSPRVPTMSPDQLRNWHSARSQCLSHLAGPWARLDLDMIGALGAPSYWSFNASKKLIQDYGASRWEMKTRQNSQEFVGDRLRKLASSVSLRSIEAVEKGLRGLTPDLDEAGGGDSASRTPTGLMPPRATDNARAWCALWGLSVFGVTACQQGASRTTGHTGSPGQGFFYLPVMNSWWPLGRLRTVLRSTQLAAVIPESGDRVRESVRLSAPAWLKARGVEMVAVFPVHRGGSASAPERWAELGHDVLLGTP
jgi:CRISPR-associated protein Csb3